MYLSFGRKLFSLGKVRFGVGFRLKGWTGAIMIFLYAMLYMCWYLMLGTLWMLYGIGYLFIYLPVKYISKWGKESAQKKKIEDAKLKYERPTEQ